jgi:surface antigen
VHRRVDQWFLAPIDEAVRHAGWDEYYVAGTGLHRLGPDRVGTSSGVHDEQFLVGVLVQGYGAAGGSFAHDQSQLFEAEAGAFEQEPAGDHASWALQRRQINDGDQGLHGIAPER